jgi:hypothetical protein
MQEFAEEVEIAKIRPKDAKPELIQRGYPRSPTIGTPLGGRCIGIGR